MSVGETTCRRNDRHCARRLRTFFLNFLYICLFFSRILKSEALVNSWYILLAILLACEQQTHFRKLFDIRFSYKHCNFSRVCPLVKMASKSETRSIRRGKMNGYVLALCQTVSQPPPSFCHTLVRNTWSLLSSRRERVRSDRSRIEDLSILNNATKKEQGDKGMVFSSSKRDFDFLNSCLYLSIGDVLCG